VTKQKVSIAYHVDTRVAESVSEVHEVRGFWVESVSESDSGSPIESFFTSHS